MTKVINMVKLEDGDKVYLPKFVASTWERLEKLEGKVFNEGYKEKGMIEFANNLSTFQDEINQLRKIIAERDARIHEDAKKLKYKNDLIEEKDGHIKQQRQEIDHYEKQGTSNVRRLETLLHEKTTIIEQLNKDLKAATTKANKLERRNRLKDDDLQICRETIGTLERALLEVRTNVNAAFSNLESNPANNITF